MMMKKMKPLRDTDLSGTMTFRVTFNKSNIRSFLILELRHNLVRITQKRVNLMKVVKSRRRNYVP